MTEPQTLFDVLGWEPLPDEPLAGWARRIPAQCTFVEAGVRRSPEGQKAYILSYREPDGTLEFRVVIKPPAA